MDAFIHERIEFADVAICKYASSKIMEGDVILTYAKNDLIQMLLTNAVGGETKNYRVILVDSRPLLEGKNMLQELMDAGIECTYILLNSLSYVMKEVTKVFLGASALMSDGSILSRVGTASVAMMARSHNVPVLVCCETYKISNRVQLESITGNELGDPNSLLHPSKTLEKWKEKNGGNLRLLNLLYDLTPNEFVSGIVTEMGILPPTSVAVLLREMNPQDNGFKAEEQY
jgi:translation initiation factor eIF-2B subunit delta